MMVIITKYRCGFVAATRQMYAVAFCSGCASGGIMKKYFIYLFLTFSIYSCSEKEVEMEVEGNYLVRKIYFEDGSLSKLLHYTRDTVLYGDAIEYRLDGSISKWYWYDSSSKYPVIYIYYDSLNQYNGFKGKAFIQSLRSKSGSDLYISVIHPPKINYLTRYREFENDNLLLQYTYEPAYENKVGWITLENHTFKKKHKYFLYYYFLDNKKKIIDSSFVELVP
jgi:hypothetical protein